MGIVDGNTDGAVVAGAEVDGARVLDVPLGEPVGASAVGVNVIGLLEAVLPELGPAIVGLEEGQNVGLVADGARLTGGEIVELLLGAPVAGMGVVAVGLTEEGLHVLGTDGVGSFDGNNDGQLVGLLLGDPAVAVGAAIGGPPETELLGLDTVMDGHRDGKRVGSSLEGTRLRGAEVVGTPAVTVGAAVAWLPEGLPVLGTVIVDPADGNPVGNEFDGERLKG